MNAHLDLSGHKRDPGMGQLRFCVVDEIGLLLHCEYTQISFSHSTLSTVIKF